MLLLYAWKADHGKCLILRQTPDLPGRAARAVSRLKAMVSPYRASAEWRVPLRLYDVWSQGIPGADGEAQLCRENAAGFPGVKVAPVIPEDAPYGIEADVGALPFGLQG